MVDLPACIKDLAWAWKFKSPSTVIIPVCYPCTIYNYIYFSQNNPTGQMFSHS